jgi:hypothetical protein
MPDRWGWTSEQHPEHDRNGSFQRGSYGTSERNLGHDDSSATRLRPCLVSPATNTPPPPRNEVVDTTQHHGYKSHNG